jgi:tetratricopeptide (TPR) repeat protein
MAHFLLGKVLNKYGQIAAALKLIMESQQLFEVAGKRGESMAAVSLGEQGNALKALGILNKAAEKYKEAIKRAKNLNDYRQVAVHNGQLATVWTNQRNFSNALALHQEARTIFEQQQEPQMVATAWQNIGSVYTQTGRYDEAEASYKRALRINTQIKARGRQANTLNQLGLLYSNHLNRPKEALTFYGQAVEIYVVLNITQCEGRVRNNIADTLCKLKLYNKARYEITQAIECNRQFTNASRLWLSLGILYDIETATGNSEAAQMAWHQARDTYLTYRQQGGYAQSGGGRLVTKLLELIEQKRTDEIGPLFNQLMDNSNSPKSLKHLIQAIRTVLYYTYDVTLADNMELHYTDAAELLFLINQLQVIYSANNVPK